MRHELVGCCGDGRWPDVEQIDFELGIGIALLRLLCGKEPPGTALEAVWFEHDSGQYAEICLVWEQGALFDREWRYFTHCERALTEIDDSVDWRALWEARQELQAEQSSPGDDGDLGE
jgi:hypothetical protein